jgi:alpha-glucosidase
MKHATRLLLAALAVACNDDGDAGTPVPDAATPTPDAATPTPDAATPTPDALAGDAAAPTPDAAVPACPATFTDHVIGGWAVGVTEAGAWRVTPPGGAAPTLASTDACAAGADLIRTGAGAPGVVSNFGAFRIDTGALNWTAPAGPPRVEVGDTVRLVWATAAGDAALSFSAYEGGGLRLGLDLPDPQNPDQQGGELSAACSPDEGFFGLGTQVIGLDLRGRTYPLWTQEQGIGKPDNGQGFPVSNAPEAAYAPMGVWHSSAGFTALIGTDTYAELDLCKTSADRWRLRTYGEAPSFVLLPGATPADRLQALGELVGRPTMPPPWVFAPWNDAVGGPARLAEVADRLRTEEIPSSAIWSEDWIGGEQTANGFRLSYAWEWDPARYPDLPADIRRLHDRGFAFLAYFNSFVPEPTRMWDEGVAGGFLVKRENGQVYDFVDPGFRKAGLADLTNPDAIEWMVAYQRRAVSELGIDGWMADFAEWLPWDALMASGEPGYRAHNRYPLDWQRANRRSLAEGRPEAPDNTVYFARSGWASVNGSTAAVAPALWAGDQNTDWDRDDGLPSVIPISVHAGLAGVSMFGSDIAGYTSVLNPNTDKELFFRWSTLGAFHPLMRTHHGSDECGNWSFDRDADTLVHYRRYATLHTLLYPYFHALMAESVARGVPVLRHPYLVAPDAPALWRENTDVFFVGDALFVAPIVSRGATSRTARLPGAGWWPLLGAAPLPAAENDTYTLEAAATEIPAFVRPGTALPLLPSAPATFYGAVEPGVSTLADVEGRFVVALYPDAAGNAAGHGVTAADLPVDAAPDWTLATQDGAPLPACAEAAADASCQDETGVTLRGPGGTVEVGGATLSVSSETPGEWRFAYAGAAFGAWAEPTPVGDLHAIVPPPCEVAP